MTADYVYKIIEMVYVSNILFIRYWYKYNMSNINTFVDAVRHHEILKRKLVPYFYTNF